MWIRRVFAAVLFAVFLLQSSGLAFAGPIRAQAPFRFDAFLTALASHFTIAWATPPEPQSPPVPVTAPGQRPQPVIATSGGRRAKYAPA